MFITSNGLIEKYDALFSGCLTFGHAPGMSSSSILCTWLLHNETKNNIALLALIHPFSLLFFHKVQFICALFNALLDHDLMRHSSLMEICTKWRAGKGLQCMFGNVTCNSWVICSSNSEKEWLQYQSSHLTCSMFVYTVYILSGFGPEICGIVHFVIKAWNLVQYMLCTHHKKYFKKWSRLRLHLWWPLDVKIDHIWH